LSRVKKPNGKILLVEPYVSILSYPIYKIFHQEKTSIYLRERDLVEAETKDPSIGDQIVAQTIFNRKSIAQKLETIFGDGFEITVIYRDILSFFATGGVNKPLKTPSSLIKLLLKLEKKVPQPIMRLIASRIVIEIEFTFKEDSA
jgi:hypothetical protein